MTSAGGPLELGLSDEVEHALLTWVYPQRKHIAQLVQSASLTESDVARTLERLTEAAAHTLGVARASVWSLRPDGSAIDCLDLYELDGPRHSSGGVIHCEEAPAYFRALYSERVIAAHDARTDPRTAEFRSDYLEPHGVTSMLDAPVFLDGKARAVICHEQVGPPREWHFWEQLVASTFADFVALVLDAEARMKSAARRQAYAEDLERQVAERTQALSQSEQNLHALLQACPIPIAVVRSHDHQVIYANRRAFALFDLEEELPTFSAGEFWDDQETRRDFLTRVFTDGHVHDVEVRLRKASGQVFWARMDAQVMRLGDELVVVAGIVDVTEHRRARAELRRSEAMLRTLLDSAPNPLVVTRLDDSVVRYCNAAAAAMFELSVDELIGRSAPDFYVDPGDRTSFVADLHRHGRVESFTAQLRTARGRPFWAILNAKTLDLEGEALFMCGFYDHSAQKELEDRLRLLATTDELTGAFNRRHFFEVGEAELHRAARYGHPTSLAMIDVDHFKSINDQLGHRAGDAALRGLVALVREEVRRVDLVARMGGEEFALLFPQTSLTGARRTLERIRALVASRALADHHLLADRRITISVGLAEHQPSESLSDVLERADQGLYQAKTEGRDRVRVKRAAR